MADRKKRILYSIVIPAYREEAFIGNTLDQIYAYLRKMHQLDSTEVIVVAAYGNDDTAPIARKKSSLFPHFKLIEPGPKVGKGRDVRLGMLAAEGEYVLFTDADLATPLHHVETAWQKLKKHKGVVIGIRDLHKIHSGHRMVTSVAANLLIRAVILPRVPDSQCGFKAFTKTAVRDIFNLQRIDGWGFDVEVLAIAKKHRYRIQRLKVKDWNDPKDTGGLVGESAFSANVRTLKELYRIRLNMLLGLYDNKAH